MKTLIVLLLECIKACFKAHFKALRSGFPMILITLFFVRDKDPFPRHGHIFSASFLVMAGSRQSHHRVGYDSSWEREFPWHQPVFDASNTTVEGLLCNICKRHRTGQRNKAGTWSTKPCTLLRRDILQRHKRSLMHKEAEEMEATRLASKKDGGISQVMSVRVLARRKAIIGAFQMMYWLAKEEIPHTTHFSFLKDLVVRLGWDYMRDLFVRRNAQYTSEQTIAELLQCLAQVIEEKTVADIESSAYFSLMTDESTDVSVEAVSTSWAVSNKWGSENILFAHH